MIRDNSSICLSIQYEVEFEKIEEIDLINELKKRNRYHKSIINGKAESPLSFLKKPLTDISSNKSIYKPIINYVFSFYVFERSEDFSENKIKLLLEPSMVGLDDMLSSNHNIDGFDLSSLDFSKLKLKDIDLFCYSNTYISWVTLVTLVEEKYFANTLNLLIALETRLQLIWNKCYSTGLYIDKIIEDKIQIRNIDELYWNSAKILVEAKSIVSSTLSSRGNAFFEEMIKTSNLEGEIFRLEKKINLLDKYVSKINNRVNLRYQKSIEILLLITALASLIQLLLPIPIFSLSKIFSYILILLVTILGVFFILKRK